MEYTITMAEVCELAHQYTIDECRAKKIVIDSVKDDNTVYTDEAQAIFDRHYDLITNTLNL